jgi:hypothetical protein
MNIASVSTPTPPTPVGASPPKASDATAGVDGGSATPTYQPTPPPPLPPGQGTRVDQLV